MNLQFERPPRAAVISPDPSFRAMIMTCLEEAVPAAEWVLRAESEVNELRPESVERLADRDPELLFLDVGSSPSAGVRFILAATARLPGLTVIAAGDALGVDELLELIQAGASGYLRRPWNRSEAMSVCSGLVRKLPSNQVARPEPEPLAPSHVITLFAPKGGTGVSTLAANLSVHIRRATAKKTLLVDLSPEMGTSSVLMGVESRYSYLDIMESLQRMDERLLYSFLEEHESGAWVLPSPAGAATARELAQESVAAILRLTRRHFEYVVVDAGRGVIDAAALAALDLADERLVVTTGELPTLRNVRQALPYLPTGSDPAGAIRLVVNRYEEGVSVPTQDIERAIGLPVFQVLDEDRERVGRSVNLGRPVVMGGPSPYARAVAKLGDRLAAGDLTGRGKKSPLRGLLRGLIPTFGRKSGPGDAGNTGGSHANGRPTTANGRGAGANGRETTSNGRRVAAKGQSSAANERSGGSPGRRDRTGWPAGTSGTANPTNESGVR